MTTIITLALVLGGLFGYRSLPISALPQVDFPTIGVTALLPGANPDTMAAVVATQLEREFSTIAGISSITSSSALGQSQITIQFDLDRNIDSAALDVQSAISRAQRRLPPEMTGRSDPQEDRRDDPEHREERYLQSAVATAHRIARRGVQWAYPHRPVPRWPVPHGPVPQSSWSTRSPLGHRTFIGRRPPARIEWMAVLETEPGQSMCKRHSFHMRPVL